MTILTRAIPAVALVISMLVLVMSGAGEFAIPFILVVGILCLALAFQVAQSHGKVRIPFAAWLAILAIGLLALSMLPLPGHLDAATGEIRYAQNNIVRQAIVRGNELGLLKTATVHFAVTRNRAGTFRTLLLAIAVTAVVALAAGMPQRQKKRLFYFSLIFATLVAVAGFCHHWIWPRKKTLWWLLNVAHGKPIGCFINRTHFAGFLALFYPVALATTATTLFRKKWLHAAMAGISFLVIGFVILTSLSRGALLSAAAAVIVVILSLLFSRRFPLRIVALLVCLLLVGATVCSLKAISNTEMRQKVSNRLATLKKPTETASAESRFALWRDSISVWQDYPMIGAGANAFRSVFPAHRMTDGRKNYHHVENEYLEVLTDTGILGALIVFAIAFGLGVRLLAQKREEHDPLEIGLALAGATAAVAVHNAVDFPMHIPLYAISFSLLIGLAFAGRNVAFPLRLPDLTVPCRPLSIVIALTGLIILLSPIFGSASLYSQDSPAYIDSPKRHPAEVVELLSSAPTSWEVWRRLGHAASVSGNPRNYKFAADCIARASTYDPKNYLLWEQLGYARLAQGNRLASERAFERMQTLRAWKTRPVINSNNY